MKERRVKESGRDAGGCTALPALRARLMRAVLLIHHCMYQIAYINTATPSLWDRNNVQRTGERRGHRGEDRRRAVSKAGMFPDVS